MKRFIALSLLVIIILANSAFAAYGPQTFSRSSSSSSPSSSGGGGTSASSTGSSCQPGYQLIDSSCIPLTTQKESTEEKPELEKPSEKTEEVNKEVKELEEEKEINTSALTGLSGIWIIVLILGVAAGLGLRVYRKRNK